MIILRNTSGIPLQSATSNYPCSMGKNETCSILAQDQYSGFGSPQENCRGW